jgi:oxalate decarboxylase/phosphoglucose isomerase-like protein (cupin superfamily)
MPLRDKIQFIERKLQKDARGSFLKIIHGKEPHLPAHIGEIYAVWAGPGQSRAGHYHPKTGEWFTVLKGECQIHLADPVSGERMEQLLLGDVPITVYVPAGIAHRFDNTSRAEEFMLLVYSENTYDPLDTVQFSFGQ